MIILWSWNDRPILNTYSDELPRAPNLPRSKWHGKLAQKKRCSVKRSAQKMVISLPLNRVNGCHPSSSYYIYCILVIISSYPVQMIFLVIMNCIWIAGSWWNSNQPVRTKKQNHKRDVRNGKKWLQPSAIFCGRYSITLGLSTLPPNVFPPSVVKLPVWDWGMMDVGWDEQLNRTNHHLPSGSLT